MVKDTRTGWMPVCGAVLLCTLTFFLIKAWQGADLAYDFHCLTRSISQSARSLLPEPVDSFPLRYDVANTDEDRAPTLLSAPHMTQNSPLQALPIAYQNLVVAEQPQYETTPVSQVSFRATKADSSVAKRVINDSLATVAEWFQFVVANFISHRVDPDPDPDPAPALHYGNTAVPQYEATDDSHNNNIQKWVMPRALIAELESLNDNPLLAAWSQSTIQMIRGLERLDGIADPASPTTFEQLNRQLDQLDFITMQVSTVPAETASQAQGELATTLRQLRYAIERRLAVWPTVHKLAGRQVNRIGLVENQQVGQFLLASSSRLNTSAVEHGWQKYLRLDSAAQVFNSLQPNDFARRKAARSVLSRLYSPSLSMAQKRYLTSAIDEQTVNVLRVSATDLVNLEEFLLRLEKQELYDNGATEFYLNDHYQSLLWSEDDQLLELAQQLQTHYRNANFRVSVSEQLLNRMIPQQPDTQEPYRDKIMGAYVTGQTRISNQVHIGLIPDPNQISMRLETVGKVHSRTTATRSGVVVENEGTSRFKIIKRLAFGQQGIFAYRPETTSQMKQRVVGLRSNMDKIPPLGWVVRKIARNKIDQQAPMTNRYAQNKLETQAESRFEKEIEQKLTELETMLTERLLHPLIAMDLEPEPVEISTTADRINMRYRLAGRDQMAANSARPRAIQSCLMSMQIHESAMNNIISRFEFAGKKFNSEELIQYINQVFQINFVIDDGKKRKPAEFEFAAYDPFRIDFEEDKIAISINLKSFKIGNGKRWKKLNLRVIYQPQIEDGFRVRLTQGDTGLRIKGKRLNAGDQIAIGVICEVLFPNQFEIALMPEKLGRQLNVSTLRATQFVVSNGWIGLSVDDVPQIASPLPQVRQGRKFLNRRSH